MGDQKMAKWTKIHPITIDLNQFKLHVRLKDKIELTLLFNSPSRRFYLSLIAFVINEMKRLGKITSIPLGAHHDLLALLNDTVGGSAGGSEEENLLSRIYRKWQHALPNLEEAPLFKVLGKKKEYGEGSGKTYPFTDAEKDSWANLFEYKGSDKNVRLKFAIDKIGADLDDVEIIYEDDLNSDAWERFIRSLRDKVKVETEKAEFEENKEDSEESVAPAFLSGKRKSAWPIPYRWATLIVAIGMVAGAAAVTIREFHIRYTPQLEIASAPAGLEVASREKTTFSLPDKPSIAVLPFVNISGDKEQEYFSDGLTEELITALSRTPKLLVIARNSSFVYKGKAVNVQQVGKELGVKYVLEGSIRKAEDRVRITVQLVDSQTGQHLWAERYDRGLKNIFALQDEITMKVINAMAVTLTEGEQARLTEIGTNNLEAYLKVLQGKELYWRYNRVDNTAALELFKEAVKMDPHYAMAYARLASAYWIEVWLGFGKSPEESISQGLESSKKAIALNDSLSLPHQVLAGFSLLEREHEKAISEGKKVITINPNSADGYAWLGQILTFSGKPEEAIPNHEIAIRLDPFARSSYFHLLCMACREAGRYEEAIAACQEAIRRESNNVFARVILASTYIATGREEEARAEAAEVLRINPQFSLERFARVRPHIDPENTARFIDTLRKAGLK
jgi:TolB-like protein/Tfp pilus assembly protein PilF/ribosomal protein L31E